METLILIWTMYKIVWKGLAVLFAICLPFIIILCFLWNL